MTEIQQAQQQVWYITGCTSGTGYALVEKLLDLPNVKVAGTTRNLDKLNKLPISKKDNFLSLEVNIVDPKSVQESIDKTINHFGTITHVVNNAGYGIYGAVEEVSDEESRKLFDALYFGPLNIIRAVLPLFRSKKDGYIFNISSTAGFRSVARFGDYCAAKFAVTGMTEALALDVKPFNIKVTNVIIGVFETGFADSMTFCKDYIKDYETIETYLPKRKETLKQIQVGDPFKLADVLIENSVKSELPCNLFVGTPQAFESCEIKIKQLSDQISSQKERNSNVVLEK